MKRIRGGSGLGDSIYIRPIVDHFIRAGEQVTVCSDYPEIFLDTGAQIEPFTRQGINVVGHYAARKQIPATNQWEDICISAGVSLPLRFEWEQKNVDFIDSIIALAAGRPIIVVHGGRTPMGRKDAFGAELLPEKRAFDVVLGALADCCLVQIGNAQQIYDLPTEKNLNGSTSVADLLDLASIADGMVGQCSFIIPLAEAFAVPLLCIWSRRGLEASEPYVKASTPSKILSAPTSRFVIDDWSDADLKEAAHAFCPV